jgi:hypothetical protein
MLFLTDWQKTVFFVIFGEKHTGLQLFIWQLFKHPWDELDGEKEVENNHQQPLERTS